MPELSVIMRSCNDAWVIGDTLEGLFQQERKDFELINVDSGSTDGTVEIIKKFNPHLMQIPQSSYKPGPALNMASHKSQGEVLVFLNSDATPMDKNWLDHLVAPFSNPDIGATFGCQVPRPDARPIVRLDYERAFGKDSLASGLERGGTHFFSLGNSAIRRKMWEEHQFSGTLQYSEDVEWSYWAKSCGHRIKYVPEAKVIHSHNYTLRQTWKRFAGEGEAEAKIFPWSHWRASFLRYSLLPLLSTIWRDTAYCVQHFELVGLCEAPLYRSVEKLGRFWGFRKGRKSCLSV